MEAMGQSNIFGPQETRALSTYTHLRRAAGVASARLQRRVAAREQLTESQVGVLRALLHRGPLSHRALADRLSKTSGNLTVVIDNLEKRSLVRRERNPRDRRSVSVVLTPGGRQLIEEVLPRWVEGIVDEMSPLDAAEQEELGRLCLKLRRQET
jgi:MarR family 2-MHQ and catechol resistance regulon transcriptional repressor